MEAIVRHSAEQRLVALVKVVHGTHFARRADVGADIIDSIVAVAVAAPAEIEMEKDPAAAVLIAVAHKAVPSLGSHTAINYGVMQTQLGDEAVSPLLVGVAVGPEDRPHTAAIIEMVLERIVNTGHPRPSDHAGGGAAAGRITHMETDTHMIHQRGNSQLLLIRTAQRHLVRHIVPVVKSVGEIGRLGSIGRTIVGLVAMAEGGITPVAHHLCLCCSRTACGGVLRGEQGIASVLVPMGLQQRTDTVVVVAVFRLNATHQLLPLCGIGCRGRDPFVYAFGNQATVGLHPLGQLDGQRPLRQAAMERIGYHRACTVIGRHHDEASLVAHEQVDFTVLPRHRM